MLDRRPDSSARVGRRLCLAKVRIELIELPHLAVGTPERIARPRVAQVRRAGRLEPALQRKAAGQFVGQRLMVDKAIGAGGVEGPFVEAQGIELAAFEACDLRAHQRGAVFKVLGAVLRPDRELSVVGGQRLDMLLPLVGCGGVAACGVGQRTVKVKVRRVQW